MQTGAAYANLRRCTSGRRCCRGGWREAERLSGRLSTLPNGREYHERMPKDALEVHFLNVGDADCILVTRWNNDKPWRLLIDGGDRDTVDRVKSELKDLDAT